MGLTLLEVLVVFVLASLVATLLLQGAGFFLGQYDNVKRIGREASSEALQQRWFASTVQAMVPYLVEDRRRFVGDSTFFQGVTTQPLRARSGFPVATRWSIVTDETRSAVVYTEQAVPCPPSVQDLGKTEMRASRRDRDGRRDSQAAGAARGSADACGVDLSPLQEVAWTVLESDEPLTFEYAGLDRVWQPGWAPAEDIREWIPRQVRLITSTGQTVLTATFGLYQEPLGNPKDFR